MFLKISDISYRDKGAHENLGSFHFSSLFFPSLSLFSLLFCPLFCFCLFVVFP